MAQHPWDYVVHYLTLAGLPAVNSLPGSARRLVPPHTGSDVTVRQPWQEVPHVRMRWGKVAEVPETVPHLSTTRALVITVHYALATSNGSGESMRSNACT